MSVTLYFVSLNRVCCILHIPSPSFVAISNASAVSCALNSMKNKDKFRGEPMCPLYMRQQYGHLVWLIPGLRHIIHVRLPGWAYFCLWQRLPGAGWTCINNWIDYVLDMGTPRTTVLCELALNVYPESRGHPWLPTSSADFHFAYVVVWAKSGSLISSPSACLAAWFHSYCNSSRIPEIILTC